jgi:hypothetical protein
VTSVRFIGKKEDIKGHRKEFFQNIFPVQTETKVVRCPDK